MNKHASLIDKDSLFVFFNTEERKTLLRQVNKEIEEIRLIVSHNISEKLNFK